MIGNLYELVDFMNTDKLYRICVDVEKTENGYWMIFAGRGLHSELRYYIETEWGDTFCYQEGVHHLPLPKLLSSS